MASGLCGTWVPLACGSFGVTVELLEGNTGRGWCRWHREGGHNKPPGLQRAPGTAHLRQEVSCSRETSRQHSGSVTFLALSEKRSNSEGEIK